MMDLESGSLYHHLGRSCHSEQYLDMAISTEEFVEVKKTHLYAKPIKI